MRRVVAEGAAQALGKALETIPTVPPIGAAAEWATDYSDGEIVIDLVGYSLDKVSVSLQVSEDKQTHVFESIEARERGHHQWWGARSAQFEHVEMGSRISVFVAPESLTETLTLTVWGRDLLGSRVMKLPLDGPAPTPPPPHQDPA